MSEEQVSKQNLFETRAKKTCWTTHGQIKMRCLMLNGANTTSWLPFQMGVGLKSSDEFQKKGEGGVQVQIVLKKEAG